MGEYQRVTHEFEPVWREDSAVLILGTMPSVKSRENGFYYGHPQNRFWRVMAGVLSCEPPADVPAKKEMLLQNRIALWDVLQSCEIVGSGDASIRSETPNDLTLLLKAAPVRAVFTNGRKAESLYRRFCLPQTGMASVCLPSTSPANASWTLEKLTEKWRQGLEPALHMQGNKSI